MESSHLIAELCHERFCWGLRFQEMGKGGNVLNATLLPPELFCISKGSGVSCFCVWLTVDGKVTIITMPLHNLQLLKRKDK